MKVVPSMCSGKTWFKPADENEVEVTQKSHSKKKESCHFHQAHHWEIGDWTKGISGKSRDIG